ncbi:MAG: hypothetical protein LUC97_01295 [Clostridiales bacterium]|nr:hypothetical protein [Clostridiales bacterium]MCD8214275.1 hypothetical protein [Clostridiales bacterium]
MTRDETVKRLIECYEGYFDIHYSEASPIGLYARCDFHIHNSKYVLVKSAKLWEADCHEYVYIFSVDKLTEEVFERCRAYVIQEGDKLIDPKPGHMYTYLTAVFICDDFTKEAVKLLKRSKRYKSYKLSLNGWSEFRTFMIKADDKTFFSNKAGKESSKLVKNL